jgi:hypothetical protein
VEAHLPLLPQPAPLVQVNSFVFSLKSNARQVKPICIFSRYH